MLGVQTRPVHSTPLTPAQAQAQKALLGQKRVTGYPYFSRIKFFAQRVATGGAGFFYEVQQGTEARAFSYAVRDSKTAAGFTTADGLATDADTNLSTANQTISGQAVAVHGLAIQPLPASLHLNDGDSPPHRVRPQEHLFMAALHEAVSVKLELNGDENSFRLGSMGLIPGAGGLQGQAIKVLDRQGVAGEAQQAGYASNGWPTRGNYYKLPEGLIWNAQGNQDAMLNVTFRATRTIRLYSGGSPENEIGDQTATNDDGVATAVLEYNFPTEIVFEAIVHLVGAVIGPRTRAA